jgi:malonate transporter and related proteins
MTLILNSIVPIFALIALGALLKRSGLTDEAFIKISDKLVYYIFFPALLFWKIGKPAASTIMDWNLTLAVLCSVFVVFAVSLASVKYLGLASREVGSFSQGCYRFSSYVGMAVALAVLGEDGVRQFAVLIGVLIPFINVLAVSTLIWFSEESYSRARKAMVLGKALISNPLIIACLAGIFYSTLNRPFPIFVDSTLAMMSLLALPLALLSIGGSLNFSALGGHLYKASAAAAFKLVLLPLVGYFCLKAFHVSTGAFPLAMIYFALPTSPVNYILSAQLNSDVDLATAAIVLSTLLSIVSLSVTMIMLQG